ncbi:hypothetical protein [Actinophytocola sp.]|uniref:hypothetical protein n=1 Tax=Actinophytocola sp. TaxID=1872138 RepID=UPI002ED54726
MITQEAVTAEINYRLERAKAAALAEQVRRSHPSRLRRWLSRVSRSASSGGLPRPRLRVS